MKKLILLLTLTFGFAFSSFAQEYTYLTVQIKKDNDLISTYRAMFSGLPSQEKRTSSVSYVKEIKAIKADSVSALHEVVMDTFEYGTALNFDKDKIEVVIFDDVKFEVGTVNDTSTQKPQNNTYKVEFPAKLTNGMVPIAQIGVINISYSLE